MIRYVLPIALFLGIAALAMGQCRNGSCQPASPEPPEWEWRNTGDNPAASDIYHRGRLVGRWDYARKEWRPFAAGSWAAPLAPPWEDQEGIGQEPEPVENFGVDRSKFHQGGYKISGKDCSRDDALRAIEYPWPDEQAKPWITVLGSQPARESAGKAIADFLGTHGQGEACILTVADPADKVIKRRGFALDKDPTVFVQDHKGKLQIQLAPFTADKHLPRLAQCLAKLDQRFKVLVAKAAGLDDLVAQGGGLAFFRRWGR